MERHQSLKQALLESVQPTIECEVRPQASDDVNDSFIIAAGSAMAAFVLALWYWVTRKVCGHDLTLEELRQVVEEEKKVRRLESSLVSPHSEEDPGINVTKTEENVTFMDMNKGATLDISGSTDPLRDQPLNVDATLDNFFSRPLKIYEAEWGVGLPLSFSIDPWSLYFTNPRVINRISNYKLMKANLHVKVMLNGNSFHYGRAIVSYNPMRLLDTMTVDRSFLSVDVVAASQRPHIWLNPTTSEGADMVLPFFFYKNLWDVVAMDWQQMGELVCHTTQSLKHANGASDAVTVSIFAWAEDVSFSVPTQLEPGAIAPQSMEIVPQADEYQKGPISRIAGSIAKFAGHLTQVPYIGLYARATEIGATAVGSIATLFGYSSPAKIDYQIISPKAAANLANTNADSDVTKLTVDTKQELSVDPRTVGLDSTDQMTIQHIAKTESYLDTFDWNLGTAPETLLFSAVVDPSTHRAVGGELHFPAPAFAVMPFKYWRGSMRFRFMVVCSGYHKGRLKIVYDPESSVATSEYNTAYTTIVDISKETDFTIDVGWGQPTTWRQHRGLSGSTLRDTGSTPVSYSASSVNYGNGVLSVYVVNELTVPNTVANNDISVNVFVSMLDDFEVCVPTDEHFSKLRLTRQGDLTAPQSTVEPHSLEQGPIEPTNENSIVHLANKTELDDPSSLFHFGEAIGSMRTLLKRFMRYEVAPLNPTSATGQMRGKLQRPGFPLRPGYTGVSLGSGWPIDALAAGDYVFTYMTHLVYITSAYAGWRGGLRYIYDFSQLGADGTSTGVFSAQVVRGESNLALSTMSWLPSSTSATPMGALMNEFAPGLGGSALISSTVNGVLAFELPHYTEYRYQPAKRIQYSGTQGTIEQTFQGFDVDYYAFVQNNGAAKYAHAYTAAAEDFTCFWYLGPPIFYIELTYPTA